MKMNSRIRTAVIAIAAIAILSVPAFAGPPRRAYSHYGQSNWSTGGSWYGPGAYGHAGHRHSMYPPVVRHGVLLPPIVHPPVVYPPIGVPTIVAPPCGPIHGPVRHHRPVIHGHSGIGLHVPGLGLHIDF